MAAIFAPETDSDHAVLRKRLKQRDFRGSSPATCTERLASRRERCDRWLTSGDTGKSQNERCDPSIVASVRPVIGFRRLRTSRGGRFRRQSGLGSQPVDCC